MTSSDPSKSKTKIPKKMQWLFWSYPVKELDLKQDKEYIITQALNYGTWEDLKWLFRTYSEQEIKKILKRPGRGMWFKDVLNFWNLMFDLKLKRKTFKKATFDLKRIR